MAFNHITSCIPDGQQKTKGQVMLEHGVPAIIVGAVIGFLLSGGSFLAAAAGFGGTIPLAIVTGFCDWWFHYRLVCIKDDQCAVGTVGLILISRGVTDPDLDYCINLVLAPILKDSLLNAKEQLPHLPPINRKYLEFSFPDLPLDGVDKNSTEEDEGGIAAHGVKTGTTALHCEIEGTGMKAVCAAATAAGVVGAVAGGAAGAAAVAGCLASGFFFFFCLVVAAVVAAVTSAAVTGVGWVIGVIIGGEEGSPNDVAADPDSGRVEVGDHVAIIGDFVYDSAHEGWNELHPVKKLLKLPCATGTKVPGVDPEYPNSESSKAAIEKECVTHLAEHGADICFMLSQPRDPAVQNTQGLPSRSWAVHTRLG